MVKTLSEPDDEIDNNTLKYYTRPGLKSYSYEGAGYIT